MTNGALLTRSSAPHNAIVSLTCTQVLTEPNYHTAKALFKDNPVQLLSACPAAPVPVDIPVLAVSGNIVLLHSGLSSVMNMQQGR